MNPRAISAIAARPTAGGPSFTRKRTVFGEERRDALGIPAAPGLGVTFGEVRELVEITHVRWARRFGMLRSDDTRWLANC